MQVERMIYKTTYDDHHLTKPPSENMTPDIAEMPVFVIELNLDDKILLAVYN